MKCAIPGEVYQIYKEGNNLEHAKFPGRSQGPFKGAFMEECYYDEIIFDTRMMPDHMPNDYDEAIMVLIPNEF